jgi:hypothetical protein
MCSSRYLQKALFALVVLICIATWKLNQSPFAYNSASGSTSISIPEHQTASLKTSRNYSVKPVAYIFPQYYPFEENDRIHGNNHTEWNNVNKTAYNRYGLETIRPHPSIGFYNGLEYATRKRHGEFLRENGFYGAVFHHYWFDDKPVMDHVIQAMLKDGEPNIPFMLSWANEPWTKRWNGGVGDAEVLIAQKYGLHNTWRKHFEFLLPFFRHPQYIRSEGKVQFVIYHPSHAGQIAPQMFAVWRQWAIEEGLGGMDIIETRWTEDFGIEQWFGNPPDAVNEFMPHVAGDDPARYHNTMRISRVYHRGTLACWDTSPRHSSDGQDTASPFCHPKTFQNHLVEMFRTIKADPNPVGVENFFFVNALNEWGEGNALEPSAQFGFGYGEAMKNAVAISEKEHAWPDVSIDVQIKRSKELEVLMKQPADVCVIVRTTREDYDDRTFTLSAMLRSLQAQNNPRWRAAVVQTNDIGDFGYLGRVILKQLDPRIQHVQMPDNVKLVTPTNDGGSMATDWFISQMTNEGGFCQGAKYLLITNGDVTYEANSFDAISTSRGDLIGLNVESKQTIWNITASQDIPWDKRCTALENVRPNPLLT